MALVHLNFESECLGNNTDVSIILPDKPHGTTPENFYANGKKYPVLWLLHGTFGDYTDWVRKSSIERYATARDLIVVMPSGLNSNYLNWPGFGTGYRAWDYLFDELMPLVHNWYPASSKREDNYIAGLSMGGRGVFQYVAGRPEKFAAAAVLSCAPNDLHKIQLDPNATGDQARFQPAHPELDGQLRRHGGVPPISCQRVGQAAGADPGRESPPAVLLQRHRRFPVPQLRCL